MRRLKKELWPHMVALTDTNIVEDAEQWAHTNLGVFRGRWNVVYQYNQYHFYFKSGSDATLFALRWS